MRVPLTTMSCAAASPATSRASATAVFADGDDGAGGGGGGGGEAAEPLQRAWAAEQEPALRPRGRLAPAPPANRSSRPGAPRLAPCAAVALRRAAGSKAALGRPPRPQAARCAGAGAGAYLSCVTTADGARSDGGGALRSPISAAGMKMIISSNAEIATASCGRCVLAQDRRGPSLAAGAASGRPSNLRSAASIAASRRAGRGGGGSGSQPDGSCSTAIYRVRSIARLNSGIRAAGGSGCDGPPAPQPGAGGPQASPLELCERPRILRRADHLHELRPIAELVLAARRGGDLQHVVIAQRAAVLAAAQQLGEAGDRRREARVLRRRGEAADTRCARSIGVEISRLVLDLGSL